MLIWLTWCSALLNDWQTLSLQQIMQIPNQSTSPYLYKQHLSPLSLPKTKNEKHNTPHPASNNNPGPPYGIVNLNRFDNILIPTGLARGVSVVAAAAPEAPPPPLRPSIIARATSSPHTSLFPSLLSLHARRGGTTTASARTTRSDTQRATRPWTAPSLPVASSLVCGAAGMDALGLRRWGGGTWR